MADRLSQLRSYMRIGLISSAVIGVLLVGFSVVKKLSVAGPGKIPLGPLGALLACLSIYCFLRLFETLDKHMARLRDRAVIDAGKWAFEYPYIRRRLREEQAKLDRQGGESSVLLLEVPILGDIRDKHGEEQAERTAHRITRLMCATLRGSDVTARIAEGIFLVLLPGTPPAEARNAATRLCKAARDFDLPVKQTVASGLTLLVGIAGYPKNGANIDCTFAAARHALREAARETGSTIAVSKKTFRSVEKGDSILRKVRGEGKPPSSGRDHV